MTLVGLKVLSMLGLVAMETGLGKTKDKNRVNNFTLINFVIKVVGPCHEQTLTLYMMGLQVWTCITMVRTVRHCDPYRYWVRLWPFSSDTDWYTFSMTSTSSNVVMVSAPIHNMTCPQQYDCMYVYYGVYIFVGVDSFVSQTSLYSSLPQLKATAIFELVLESLSER